MIVNLRKEYINKLNFIYKTLGVITLQDVLYKLNKFISKDEIERIEYHFYNLSSIPYEGVYQEYIRKRMDIVDTIELCYEVIQKYPQSKMIILKNKILYYMKVLFMCR